MTFEQYKLTTCRFCRRAVRYDRVNNRTLELVGEEPHTPNCPRKLAFHKDRGFANAQKRRDGK